MEDFKSFSNEFICFLEKITENKTKLEKFELLQEMSNLLQRIEYDLEKQTENLEELMENIEQKQTSFEVDETDFLSKDKKKICKYEKLQIILMRNLQILVKTCDGKELSYAPYISSCKIYEKILD